MTTEITPLSHSHLLSLYFSTCWSLHFLLYLFISSLSLRQCVFSLHFILFLCYVLLLSLSTFPPALCLSTSFLVLPALSFSVPFPSHFLSISSAASIDRLSKCQMPTSATVGIINSFLVSNTDTETRGAKERGGVGGVALAVGFG